MSENPNENNTSFGYKKVDPLTKTHLVDQVFRNVAGRYDLMNDLMSGGLHRVWKRYAISRAGLREGHTVLDVAAGTADLTKLASRAVGKSGKVIASDINDAMLIRGRDSLIDAGMIGNVDFVEADAEQLPFVSDYFDRVLIAFGLRNVTHKENALQEFYRVLKPGGKLLILEFSHPQGKILKKLYDFYSFTIIPKIGEVVAKDKDSYQYLVESIRMHPDQATLSNLLRQYNFEDVTHTNLHGGIVALHQGYKY